MFARIRRAVAVVPTPRDWGEMLVGGAVLAAVFGPLGLRTGLLHVEPRPASVVLKCAAVVLFVPALGEELPFRGALIPDRGEAPGRSPDPRLDRPVHRLARGRDPVAAAGARTFLRGDFLAWAAGLGLVCAVLRRRSGSIWPPVVLHWAAVVAWMGWLGGEPLV